MKIVTEELGEIEGLEAALIRVYTGPNTIAGGAEGLGKLIAELYVREDRLPDSDADGSPGSYRVALELGTVAGVPVFDSPVEISVP